MNRSDFGMWGAELSEFGFAAALAAMGLIRDSQSQSSDPFQIAESILLHIDSEGFAAWRLTHDPAVLAASGLPPALLLSRAWQTVLERASPRLEIEAINSRSTAWIYDTLAKSLPRESSFHSSVYVRLDEVSPVNWQWPLRIGVLPGDFFLERLQRLIRKHDWIQHITKTVELGRRAEECDLLLLPHDLSHSMRTLLAIPHLSAECALVLDGAGEPLSRALPLAKALQTLCRAAGIAIGSVPFVAFDAWLVELLLGLSQNQGIDVALRTASVSTNIPDLRLLASRELTSKSNMSRAIGDIRDRLIELKDIDAELKDGGILMGKWPEGLEVGMKRGEGGPELASLNIDLMREARQPLEAMTQSPPDRRFLQVEIFDRYSTAQSTKLTTAFRAGVANEVQVFVGTFREGGISADEPFPPLTDVGSHRLMVTFAAMDGSFAYHSNIVVPPTGDSTRCNFYVVPSGDTKRFQARITISYRNRVLQAAILQGEVAEDPTKCKGTIKLQIDAVVRPGMSDLSARREFDASITLDGADNTTHVIAQSGETVGVRLVDISEELHRLDDQISKIAKRPSEFSTLRSDATIKLLRYCAQHGANLRKILFDDRAVADTLANAVRLQVLSSQEGARLPVEFLYDGDAPLPDATLCSNAEQALKLGTCPGSCPSSDKRSEVICPLSFWGFSRVIERCLYSKSNFVTDASWDFKIQAEPSKNRPHLRPFKGALIGASARVTAASPNWKTSVQQALAEALGSSPLQAETWEQWADNIKSASPSLLLAMVHTEENENDAQDMIIGEHNCLNALNSSKRYVRDPENNPSPLVLLIGCETGAPDLSFYSLATFFRRCGAGIVVATGSTILAKHAPEIVVAFVTELNQRLAVGDVCFGEVMRDVRCNLLADGNAVALCLLAFGDADWILTRN